jgi:hypothetical protein
MKEAFWRYYTKRNCAPTAESSHTMWVREGNGPPTKKKSNSTYYVCMLNRTQAFIRTLTVEEKWKVLPPSQITIHLVFSKYMGKTMYLEILI